MRCDFRRGYCLGGYAPCDACDCFLGIKKTSAKIANLIRLNGNKIRFTKRRI